MPYTRLYATHIIATLADNESLGRQPSVLEASLPLDDDDPLQGKL